jgi:hypothetical protein
MAKTNYEYIGCSNDLPPLLIQKMLSTGREVKIQTMINTCDNFYYLQNKLGFSAVASLSPAQGAHAFSGKYKGKRCYYLKYEDVLYVFKFNDL